MLKVNENSFLNTFYLSMTMKTKTIFAALAAAFLLAASTESNAQSLRRRADRTEDQADRREDKRDRREDVRDRREDKRDRKRGSF